MNIPFNVSYNPDDHMRILKEAILSKQDPHFAVWHWLTGKPKEEFTLADRTQVKNLNFGYLYNPDFMKEIWAPNNSSASN